MPERDIRRPAAVGDGVVRLVCRLRPVRGTLRLRGRGRAATFATLVGELCEEWALEPQSVRAGGTGAVVECVSTRTETRYALKLSPDRAVTEQEAAALACWTDAFTVVDLVDVDATRGAILLEYGFRIR